ncbi:hypothetical protein D1007_41546 [Hordeum vulgare]|uniref:uncharacterized protein LOC123440836 n=1 Tax=Hordeum vulgare subsp. vulgare TaxID=112509 RepID=UPI000295A0F2|nr:uncharacterized protein LOC123440836 [Hordeum vulgare subsp. vulgare]KAE8784796.1 hypothetical protein D1007_41546 [Hordeum vulgare]
MEGLGSNTLPDSIGNKNERNRCCIFLGSIFLGWAKPTARRRTDDYGDPFMKMFAHAAIDDGSRLVEEMKILMTDEGGGRSRMVYTKGFILDSAASAHATSNLALLSEYDYETLVDSGRVLCGATGHLLPICGSGSVRTDRFTLPDVLFVPGLEKNVVSVSKLVELDYGVDLGKAGCFVRDTRTGNLVGEGRLVPGGLYELDLLKVPL